MNNNSGIKIFVDAHVFDGEFQGTRTFIKGIYTILARHDDVQLYLGASNTDNLKKNFQNQTIFTLSSIRVHQVYADYFLKSLFS